jgi:hypothetical protein
MSEMSEQKQLEPRVVDYTLRNFVGIFKNAFTKEFCESVIEQYEYMVASGHGKTRFESHGESKTLKDDTQVFADDIESIPLRKVTREFNELFWGKFYPIYEQEYSVLKDTERHANYSFKIQKTKVGGGYHVWHFESTTRELSNRLLTWILHLNDVQEGGETEFLYQHMRVKPEQGTLVIWPAAFTHTHRGNPPLSNEKYIVTGWIEF